MQNLFRSSAPSKGAEVKGSNLLIFTNWIKEYGASRLAKKLEVHHTTVQKWTCGHLPKAKQMAKIRGLSGGLVSYDVMVDGAREAGKQ